MEGIITFFLNHRKKKTETHNSLRSNERKVYAVVIIIIYLLPLIGIDGVADFHVHRPVWSDEEMIGCLFHLGDHFRRRRRRHLFDSPLPLKPKRTPNETTGKRTRKIKIVSLFIYLFCFYEEDRRHHLLFGF